MTMKQARRMSGARFARVAALLAAVMVSSVAVAMSASAAVDDDRDGPFEYKNVSSQKCLDVAGGTTANGPVIQVWQCLGGSPQKWFREPGGNSPSQLRNQASGKCIDGIAGRGAQLQQYPCDGTSEQRWIHHNQNGNIVFENSRYRGQCLDVDLGVGPRVILWDCHRGPQQQWF